MIKFSAFVLLLSQFTLFVTASQYVESCNTLNGWYEQEDNYIREHDEFLNSTSRECVKEKLKLQQLGERSFRSSDNARILTAVAFELCVEDQDRMWQRKNDEYLNQRRFYDPWDLGSESLECLKANLINNEPDSLLLEGDPMWNKAMLANEYPPPCRVSRPHIPTYDLFQKSSSDSQFLENLKEALKLDTVYVKLRIIKLGELSEAKKKQELEKIALLMKRTAEMFYEYIINDFKDNTGGVDCGIFYYT